MAEGQRRHGIDAPPRTSGTPEKKVPGAAGEKNGRPKQKALVKLEVRDVKDTELRASESVSRMNPDQTRALRSYMDGLDATDSSHAAMVAAVREGKKASAAGERTSISTDATLDWKDSMGKLRALERDAKDSGIDIAAYDLGRRKSRDALRPQLVGREETSAKTEALRNAEPVADTRPADQRPEDGPAKVVPAPQPKSAWGRTKSWMSGTPVGKAARWLGIGLIGLLGPYQDVEDRTQAEPSAMMAPVQEGLPAATVSVDDENDTYDAVKDVGTLAGAGDLATGSDQLVVSTPDADALVSFDAYDSVRLADYEYSAAEIELMRSKLEKHAEKIGVTGSVDANVAASFLKLTLDANKAYFEATQEKQKAYLQGIVDRANADALAKTPE